MTSAHGKAAKPARRSGQPRTSAVRMFAMTAPGLAGNLAAELAAFEAMTVRDEGHDGRSDVVLFEVAQSAC
ncbi:MAG TPA: hypothetical protein VFM37_04585, partial [Pseudonocardiaceae bacterium]|nr:hypothetical protein [Pseudonocardiaceae bacterium]